MITLCLIYKSVILNMINVMDGDKMELTERQKEIIEIVKDHEPIKSKDIAEKIGIISSSWEFYITSFCFRKWC